MTSNSVIVTITSNCDHNQWLRPKSAMSKLIRPPAVRLRYSPAAAAHSPPVDAASRNKRSRTSPARSHLHWRVYLNSPALLESQPDPISSGERVYLTRSGKWSWPSSIDLPQSGSCAAHISEDTVSQIDPRVQFNLDAKILLSRDLMWSEKSFVPELWIQCFCCTLRQDFASNGRVKAFEKPAFHAHRPPATFQGLLS